ncbi:MAG: GAF domain-containing protein [Woeseia sp.]
MPAKIELRKLMDQIAGASSLQDVYDRALSCLHQTLDVDRASVLVYNDNRVMQFVAWTGLSESYRNAVEGHSPWSPDEPDARSVTIADVTAAPDLAAYTSLFRQEQIGALAFIPLRFGSKLLGKFMLYYRNPHEFTDDEVNVVETIAGHIAFAIEHHRMATQLESRLAAELNARSQAEFEASLRQQNEHRLQMALAAGKMCAWEWDVASGRIQWSEELQEMFGQGAEDFAGTMDNFRRYIHPGDQLRSATSMERMLGERREDYNLEYRLVPPDGSVRWVASRGRATFDKEGRPARLVGICTDITERKRLELSKTFLAEASRILATTLNPHETVRNLAQLVVPRLGDWCIIQVVDEQGEIKPVEVAHSDPDKVEKAWQVVRRWPVPSDLGSAATAVREGESTLVPHIERKMLAARASNEEHLAALLSFKLESGITVPLKARGRTLGALTLLTAESKRTYDETDLRFAQEIASWAALAIDNAQLNRESEKARSVAERSREFLQILARVSDDLASSLDPDTALKQLAGRLVGRLADYCITYATDGVSIRRLGLAHRDPAKLPLVEALCEAGPPKLDDQWGAGAVIRSGEPILASEVSARLLRSTTKNARHLQAVRELDPWSAIVVPLRARGRTLGAIALVTTADSRQSYDHDDLKLARELASRAALLVDNARLYAQARAAIRARDDMIAVVSHDLRSPLQSISSATTLLEFERQGGSGDKSLQAIKLATSQMDRLLQDLLDLSLIDGGQLTVTRKLVRPATLIDEARTMFEPLARDKSVRLECGIAEDLPQIRVDQSRMQQALANLLGNALKFVPEGGKIVLNADQHEHGVRISVTDTGPGISEEDVARVFDRFWRADRRRERGVGLGLTVAQGIVQAHGGQIGVESRKGEGSTFFILLDGVAPARKRIATRPPKASGRKDGPVLVVDDDEPFRTKIVEALQRSGYSVVGAGDGREALEYLRGDRTPALVILDMMMPLREGWSLFEAVKHDPRLAAVPIVLLTCLGETQDNVAPPTDVSAYLKKPVRMKKLLSLAAQHCRGSRKDLGGYA